MLSLKVCKGDAYAREIKSTRQRHWNLITHIVRYLVWPLPYF